MKLDFTSSGCKLVLLCRKVKNAGDVMAMKENEAYGPVTASQQPQDYIYAQPSTTDQI